MLKLTIAVCTYNRERKLKRLLDAFAQDVAMPRNALIDFLIIDNNSPDDTQVVVNSFKKKLPLRLVSEENQGLSHARNKALSEMGSDWLIFIDDDVVPDNQLLIAYVELLKSCEFDYVAGRVLINWFDSKPKWLIDEDLALLSGVLVKFDLGVETKPLEELNEFPRGANFAISSALINSVGEFNPELGVKADIPGRGEETDYIVRARELGFKGVYCGQACCFHDGLLERLTTRYLLVHGFEKGRTEFITGNTKNFKKHSEVKLWLKAVWQLIKGRRDRYLQSVINIGMQRGYISESKA